MVVRTFAVAVVGGVAAVTSAAAQQPISARQCFWSHQVNSFAAQGDRLVNLRVGVKDYFQLELMGPCPDVDWTQKIALVSRGGSTICSGLDAEIVTPSPIGPQKCPVKSVRKLTPTEVAALPKGAKP
ncbi:MULTISPECIES: DUF6491 family protein [unclassified Caulobacter]|jgi:hypothetical protein|uniref:DUF6491 family protein n=1 Tax=Caulobacteraceae TaxID=76892 RepID=UPI000834CD81|nr:MULTISPECIES: DUF6491 family protein [unclassified Caulobacter]MBQ1561934.1 hypothetical protein [Caulobacter sp.]